MKIKKSKINVWRGALSLALVLALALSSCTQEPQGLWVSDGEGIQVRVNFAQSATSKATTDTPEEGTGDENRLKSMTILVFNRDGTALETVFSESATDWTADKIFKVTPIINPLKPKVIYAIANWDKTVFDKGTYTEEMLKNELKTITAVSALNGNTAYPMLMSGSKKVTKLSAVNYSVEVKMARQVAKVRANITLTEEVRDKMANIEWQVDAVKMRVVNIPDKSYIIDRGASPSGIVFLTSEAVEVNDTKTTGESDTWTWSESLYINENPTGTESKNATYIIVQLPYKNKSTGTIDYDNYYKLLINDKLDNVSPYKVLRNTIYDLNISILGMGLPFDNLVANVNVEDILTVKEWEKGEIGDIEAPMNYFNIDRTFMVLQMDGKSLTSKIATDVDDWKLIDYYGKTLLSFAENKITVEDRGIKYTLSGTVSEATVTVVVVESLKPPSTDDMFFIARNLKVPFTIDCDNGFIPNLVLKAKGWPDGSLPTEGGLQLAKLGTKVLPSGVVANDDDDPLFAWKTSTTTTTGVESVTEITTAQFGMGKGNTDVMTTTTEEALHSAAKYCREMGPEWYLPSVAELQLIFKCQKELLLGSSYMLPLGDNDKKSNFYWSSTESSSGNSWYVYYFDKSSINNPANTGNSVKTTSYRVRCVKGTIPSTARSFTPQASQI